MQETSSADRSEAYIAHRTAVPGHTRAASMVACHPHCLPSLPVPYAMAYSWLSPHGSKREGIIKMSQPAGYSTWQSDSVTLISQCPGVTQQRQRHWRQQPQLRLRVEQATRASNEALKTRAANSCRCEPAVMRWAIFTEKPTQPLHLLLLRDSMSLHQGGGRGN
jgi:hypothetical protein